MRRLLASTATVILAVLLLTLSACRSSSSVPTSVPAVPTERWVTVDGYDGDLLIEPINLWDDYYNRGAGSLVAQVRHGERVRYVQRDGDAVLVETLAGKQGWVNHLFIRELKGPTTPKATATRSKPRPTFSLSVSATATATSEYRLAEEVETPSPTPTSQPSVIVAADVVNVREGPSTDHERVGQVTKGTRLAVVGQNEGGDWLHVCCLENQDVWIAGWLVEQEHNSGGLLMNTPTPRPTPIPTQNAMATKRPTARPTLKPVAPAAPRICCKICRKGKACGDSCIARDKTCHKPPGCACNG